MQPPCLIIAPHPDDETIGAAVWMSRQESSSLTLAHVTDGSPMDTRDAQAAGFDSPGSYAEARRAELYAALGFIGVQRKQCIRLGFIDQTVHEHLPKLIEQLAALLNELRPEIVLTPSYEGGHPDHDSTAFAVRRVRDLYQGSFLHREYRLYHAGADAGWETGEFLPHHEDDSEILVLSPEELGLKARMAAAFRTQAGTLARFQFVDEHFRTAPLYDFTQPPHPGNLLYETFGWGTSWTDWSRRARQALSRTA